MLSDLISALIRGVTFHGFDQLTHFRRAHSPFSPWKAKTNEVVAQAQAEASRYGITAKVDRRRAYQVARLLVSNRRGDHLADMVSDAYSDFSPPSAATFHNGRRSYGDPRERLGAFRAHPQTLAYLLTPAKLARLGAGASPKGKLVVIDDGEQVNLETVATRLHEVLDGKAGSGDLRAYGEILLRLHAGVPEPENADADSEEVEAAA
ncbi:MAG: hypothetical protein GKS06_10815 [Acidobacteria bacterium]|nr:hypothetical protein [Acidobacteriota bacterium]